MKTNLSLLALLLAGCTTVHPDGSETRVDPKAVAAVSKSLSEVTAGLLDAYLSRNAPPERQTLYYRGEVIPSEVPAK